VCELVSPVIRSRENALVKRIVRLADHGRFRRDEATGIAEGWHLIQAILEAPAHGRDALHAVVISEAALGHRDTVAMRGRLEGIPVHVIDAAVYARFGEGEGPNAALGLFAIPADQDVRATAASGGLQLWLDAVQDPGNVGALIRTGAAAGARAVILGTGCADPWSPRVLRAGMGGHFALQVLSSPLLPELISGFPGQVAAMEREGGRSIFATAFGADLAVLLGNEGAGLSPGVSVLAGSRLTIPMPGRMESLNVAAAGAVICFEYVRQQTG